jgi:hypothetical protein
VNQLAYGARTVGHRAVEGPDVDVLSVDLDMEPRPELREHVR